MLWSQEALENLLHMLGGMEMPLGVYYTNTLPTEGLTPARGRHECIINFMRKSRTQETPIFFAADTNACMDGWTYLGFSNENRDKIASFVTTGLPGRGGEHYMSESASIYRLFEEMEFQKASGSYCVVKPLFLFQDGESSKL